MNNDENAVVVKDIYKSFRLPHEQSNGLKQNIVNFTKRKKGHETQRVLKDVSFEIKKGEFFGIVGRNGSGKSTLLKLIAGIYKPDKGIVMMNGSLTPFIELGVGFNHELTGRENVYMNGALLGFSHKQMDDMYDEIVSFAELEKFMDQKLKNYSSGMQVRLAFSIAIRVESDILLIDEVLAVGDSAFQQKCYETFFELKRKGITIILVTHDMGAVLKFCDRALLLSDGKVRANGKPFDISEDYLEQNYATEKTDDPTQTDVDKSAPHISTLQMRVKGEQNQADIFETNSDVVFDLQLGGVHDKPMNLGLQIFNSDGVYCFGSNTKVDNFKVPPGTKKINLDMKLSLLPGNYWVNAATMNSDATAATSYHSKIKKFRVKKTTEIEGVVNLPHEWSS